jgi:hypothetical protein
VLTVAADVKLTVRTSQRLIVGTPLKAASGATPKNSGGVTPLPAKTAIPYHFNIGVNSLAAETQKRKLVS